MNVACYFDGGCGPNNPGGHAGCGALVYEGVREIFSASVYVGFGPEMSNNVAEYAGVVAVLEFLLISKIQRATIRGDSKLVIKQLQGKWKARKGLYLAHHHEARKLHRKLIDAGAEIKMEWIPREQNFRADYLAGQAIRNAPRGQRNEQLVKLIKAQRQDDQDQRMRFEQ